ncbi:hypothetical protein Droror1_Dr00020383 [Drosera rotundifolia]
MKMATKLSKIRTLIKTITLTPNHHSPDLDSAVSSLHSSRPPSSSRQGERPWRHLLRGRGRGHGVIDPGLVTEDQIDKCSRRKRVMMKGVTTMEARYATMVMVVFGRDHEVYDDGCGKAWKQWFWGQGYDKP